MNVLAAALGALLMALWVGQAQALTLRASVVASGETVSAGDFFIDAGEAADTPLFMAPAPGMSGQVSAFRLSEAVRGIGLEWTALDPASRVTVNRPAARPSPEIGTGEIIGEIKRAILDTLPDPIDEEDLSVSLAGEHGPFALRGTAEHSIAVAQIELSQRAEHFEVLLEIRQGERRDTYRLRGRYKITLPVPVLALPVSRGEIVTAEHLTFKRLAKAGERILTDPAAIAGMAARRALRAGQTLRAGDLEAPRVVTRNQLVTIVFQLPGLLITTQGRALADAAAGESISVVNVRSNRIIQAVARGPGQVVAGTGPARLAMR